jgi:hypothetical protein
VARPLALASVRLFGSSERAAPCESHTHSAVCTGASASAAMPSPSPLAFRFPFLFLETIQYNGFFKKIHYNVLTVVSELPGP